MSSQTALDEWQTETVENDRPAWLEFTSTQNECLGCGAHVSSQFVRVSGDESGDVHACPNCATQAMLGRGAAANPEFSSRVDLDPETRRGER